jgi:RNA polymerase sigma-70 factor, ECF subfamily
MDPWSLQQQQTTAWPSAPAFLRRGEAHSGMSAAALASPNDEELLTRMAGGDYDAFGLFYDRHSNLLFSLLMKILRDTHDAEEVLQEAMLQIWERATVFDASAGKPLSWAVTITRNKAIDRLRSTQRKARLINEAAPEIAFAYSHTGTAAESSALQGEAASLVQGALASLPQQQRVAIELAFFGGLTQNEIASHLGEPLGTTKARIRRGMMALRDSLEGQI